MMIARRRSGRRRRNGVRGFTMIEVMVATVLMVLILSALATVTSQWMPNWNRGMAKVQQLDRLAVGLDRLAADLAAIEYVPLNGATKTPLFEGTPLSVSFVRTALGPNAEQGLEIVRWMEKADAQGLALVREQTRFLPTSADAPMQFRDTVPVIRLPYRVSFSYAGPDRQWQEEWQNQTALPALIRMQVRDAATDRVVSASTIVQPHVNVAANCVRAKIVAPCLASGEAEDGRLQAQNPAQPQPPQQPVPQQ